MTTDEKDHLKIYTDDVESAGNDIEEEQDESADKLLRLRAEFDNFRKRSRKEIIDIRKKAMNEFVRELFPVMANLEKAVEEAEKKYENEYSMGFRLILAQLKEIATKYGVEEINPKGEFFDPLHHEAFMVQVDDSVPEKTVLEVLEKGYICNGDLLKPARVIVSKARDS